MRHEVYDNHHTRSSQKHRKARLVSRLTIAVGFAVVLACSSLFPSSQIPTAVVASATVASTVTPEAESIATDTPISEPTTDPFASGTLERPTDLAIMLPVPAGEFVMGSDQGAESERPEHLVYLDAFWIDRTEITNGMYHECVVEKVCLDPGTSIRFAQRSDHPVSAVPWEDAARYCRWAGVRLPTEAEWEKAARGTDGRVYAWGDELDETKYYFETKADTSIPINQPVGSYPEGASPYEVLDMTGGVFEWVSDWYSETYYAESPSSNPEGPLSGDNHVIRGGDYVDFDISTFTRYGPPARGYFNSIKDLGFRCAADVEQ